MRPIRCFVSYRLVGESNEKARRTLVKILDSESEAPSDVEPEDEPKTINAETVKMYTDAIRAAEKQDAMPDAEVQDDEDEGSPKRNISINCTFDQEVFSVSVDVMSDVRIESCMVVWSHEFSNDERILLNGWQSWTDTQELPIDGYMRGLKRVPAPLIRRFVLDGSGDYRFTEYTNKPGQLHGWTYGYIRDDRTCTLIAGLDESRGFTHIRTDCKENLLFVLPEAPAREFKDGDTVEFGRFAVIERTDAEDVDKATEAAFDRWFELNGIQARTCKPACGYTTWYRHYGRINETVLCRDFDAVRSVFERVDASGFERVFQIDDGFCKIGDWLDVDRKCFPAGPAPMAQHISRKGFTPGIWLAPFAVEKDARIGHEHPDWVLCDEKGNAVTIGSNWSGAYALDTRNPEVRAYVTEVIRTYTQDWGFKLLKLDFLYAACMIPHDGMNRGELMADAMRLLRDAAGEDVLIDGCGVPLASAFGLVDYCRISCDVGNDWDDLPSRRMLHRERVSTKHSVSNTVWRAHLNRRAFRNDSDVVYLRTDVQLNMEQRTMLLDRSAVFSGVLFTSDNMGAWDDNQIERWQNAIDLMRLANR
ncbi:Alpha-galactosidase [Slackia heliotrinireducens]|uniref:Alpha-galactosidase n=1 Tax=Slackia heliotrinireducens (strain ATCC 29202 / DSM 20476 / NCTC 11029 / RHS 1) TaxID=471855 RepID=C7N3W5_SLAHD|nr:glycoside hydrolase family 36 protein [Slackia heliotrinireducens]ACV21706.1 alpha-galactosidase [Slackia heliotrinireducens DSM 20476]VEG99344.1 Alpha-galactosidase [Slackia heliotrinireducens]